MSVTIAKGSAPDVLQTRNFWAYEVAYNALNQLPPDTINWGEEWATAGTMPIPWDLQGYTDGGLHFGTDVTRADVTVDQSLDPVMRPATARSATMSFNLAEMTPQNIQLGSGQGTFSTLAPGASTKGHNDLDIGSVINDVFVSLGFDIQQQDGQPLRIIGYRCQMTGTMAIDFTSDAKAMVPVEATLLPDTSVTPARVAKIRDVIAQTGP
jgi:hypothetical protein